MLDGGIYGSNQLYSLVGNGNDYAVGGLGNDIIATGAGSDYIFGSLGDDAIVAGSGTDYISGGSGNDFIYTDDLVTSSQDFIYFISPLPPGQSRMGTNDTAYLAGIDTVADFTPGVGGDVIVLPNLPTSLPIPGALHSFADVQSKMTDIGVYTVIDMNNNPLGRPNQVYLYNVHPDQLTADNFLFL